MATNISIASSALVLMGLKPISSFSEDNDRSRTMSDQYSLIRDKVLGHYPWAITRKMAQLSRLAASPTAQWTYQFQLPADLISGPRALYTSSTAGAKPTNDFDIQGKVVLSEATTLYAYYQYRAPESLWPPHLVTLMTYALCADLADGLTDEQAKAQIWNVKAWGTASEDGKGGYSRQARALDGQDTPTEYIVESPFIAARWSG